MIYLRSGRANSSSSATFSACPSSLKVSRNTVRCSSVYSNQEGRRTAIVELADMAASRASRESGSYSRSAATRMKRVDKSEGHSASTKARGLTSGPAMRSLVQAARISAKPPESAITSSVLCRRLEWSSTALTNSATASIWRTRVASRRCSSSWSLRPAFCSARAVAASFLCSPLLMFTTSRATPAANKALIVAPITPLQSWRSQISSLFTKASYVAEESR